MPPSLEAMKALVRAHNDASNRHDFDAAFAMIAPDVVWHGPGGLELDRAGWRQTNERFHAAFPDMASTIVDQVAEGDRVATRVQMRGTHRGEFQGLAPTGRTISLTGLTIDRFDDRGLLVEHWLEFDQAGVMRQLNAGVGDGPSGPPRP